MDNRVKGELEAMLRSIVEPLVAAPALVQINSVHTQSLLAFEVRVAPQDFGKLIGERGETIKSIRHLLIAAARRRGVRVNLDTVDPDPSRRSKGQPSS